MCAGRATRSSRRQNRAVSGTLSRADARVQIGIAFPRWAAQSYPRAWEDNGDYALDNRGSAGRKRIALDEPVVTPPNGDEV
jgi:hypothetical protein